MRWAFFVLVNQRTPLPGHHPGFFLDSIKMEPNGQDQQLGYLTGQVESINKRLDEHTAEEERHWRIFHDKLNHITEELSLYNNFLKFGKLLVLSALALATFHWGDIKDIWK